MPDLAEILLNGSDTTPRSHAPAAPRRPQPAITESTVRRKLTGPVPDRLVLERAEVGILRRLLERADNDPFGGEVSTASFLNVQDLTRMGLQGGKNKSKDGDNDDIGGEVPGEDEGEGTADRLLNGGSTKLMAKPSGEIIPIEQAVVAPNATPGAEEPIPASVLNSLRVLQSTDEPQPLDSLQAQPAPTATALPAPGAVAAPPPPSSALPSEGEADAVLANGLQSQPVGTPPVSEAALMSAFSGMITGTGRRTRIAAPRTVTEAAPAATSSANQPNGAPSPAHYQNVMLEVRRGKRAKQRQAQENKRSRRQIVEESNDPGVRAAMAKASQALGQMGGAQDDDTVDLVP